MKLSIIVVKDEPVKPHAHPELLTLTENLYISPAVALHEATKAVGAMGVLAKSNFALGCRQLISYNAEEADHVNTEEDYLDQFADASDHFLIGLSKNIENDADDRQLDMLMQSVPNFERIGDYATNFVEMAEKLQAAGLEFSDMAKRELTLMCGAVNEILDVTVDAFVRNDNLAAKDVEPLEEVIDDMVMMLKDRHTKRLKRGDCTVETGLIFMECLTYLERASDQCSSIAVMMLSRDRDDILADHHEYLRNIHSGNDAEYNAEKNRRREQYIKPLLSIQ